MKNATFALVIAERLDTPGKDLGPDAWSTFLATTREYVPKMKGVQQIHENVWVIPLRDGLSNFDKLVGWARYTGGTTRVLFLEEIPDWVRVQPALPELQ
jgi:hypothetical protein